MYPGAPERDGDHTTESPDYSWLHTSPTRERVVANDFPSLARFEVALFVSSLDRTSVFLLNGTAEQPFQPSQTVGAFETVTDLFEVRLLGRLAHGQA